VVTPDSQPARALRYLALLFAAALAFVYVEPPDTTLFWDGVFDAGHTLLFAGVMSLTLRFIRQMLPALAHAPALAFAITLVLALLSEGVQLLQPTRNPNAADVLRDVAGGLLAWLLHGAARPGIARRHAWALRAGAALILGAAAVQLLLVLQVYAQRDSAFPTLARFDGSRWENRLLRWGNASLMAVPPGQGAAESPARLALQPGPTAGLTVRETFPDWTQYHRLVFGVRTTVNTPVELTIRVFDRFYRGGDQNAFVRKVTISNQPQRIEILLTDIRSGPQRRELDLRNVRGVSLFVWRLQQPLELQLEPLRLE
jgi:VanZ family protein